MSATIEHKSDGGIIYTAPPRPRTGKRLIDTFAEAAMVLKTLESGRKVAGLICPGFPWVYWSWNEDRVACERCGAYHTTPTAVDPVELASRFLIPFSNEHKECIKP